MFAGKPIIGIVGGIGSGKSFVADLLGGMGCLVIHSDEQAHQAYRRPAVRETLRQWWGDEVFDKAGEVDRAAVALRVFSNRDSRQRLEKLIHPVIDELRKTAMSAAPASAVAFVWDAPLLFEAGLNSQCDAVVFVEAPLDVRIERASRQRGWDRAELLKREKSQLPLDKKHEMSDYMVRNAADVDQVRDQLRVVLSRILAQAARR